MPRGGKRIGAGRKPKPKDGNAIARVLAHRSMPAGLTQPPTTNGPLEVEEFDAPDSLSADAMAIWLKQSPHAFRHGTLKRSTAMAFERYCELAVLERNEAKGSGVIGANHRGILKEIRAYEVHFRLIADGKPVVEPVPASPAVDEDEAFFGGPRAVNRR